MSNVTGRGWYQQYEVLKKRIQSQRVLGKEFNYEEKQSVLGVLSTLEQHLRIMSNSPLQYEMTASEIARRQVLIDHLKRQTADLSIFQGNGNNSNNGNGNNTNNTNNTNNVSIGTINPLTSSDKALVLRQKDVIKLQDQMILEIESGVGRLHEKALDINEETKTQVALLDDLDSNVDVATAALQAESKHAEKIKEQAHICWMYICIVVEVLIIIILLIVALK